ncbi:MAG: DUF4185 domain-containing protein [Draconibacterium sp.]|nr:DUF4185 domain-containing protein [Draconibacterium sp.]
MKNLIFIAIAIFAFTSCSTKQKKSNKLRPTGVEFKKETLKRLGSRGDNWCITWAKDGSQIVSMDDGNWLDLPGANYHNHLYRIIGESDNFRREDISNYPDLSAGLDKGAGSWFGYGIVAVDDDLYSVISKTPGTSWSGPFTGIKLLKSSDNGASWSRINRNGNELLLGAMDSMRNVVNNDEMFFLEEYGMAHQKQPAYPFSFVDFVQEGQNNRAAKDGFVYIYSPEGAKANKLTLARVPKNKIGVRDEWQYFTNYGKNNKAKWTKDITKRGYVTEFPEKSSKGHYFGWYSWLPSVVWNEGLGLYIMVNGGTYAGYGMTDSDKDYYDRWMHTETGSLGFWYSENPYGPWEQFFYTDYWIVDNEKNRTYQPKLSPKWISQDGTEMTLIWSDAMKNEKGQSHSVNYIWNQMTIDIVLK